MNTTVSPSNLPPHASPPPAPSGLAGIWSELIAENPMLDQARRDQKRFFRSAYGLGRFGPVIVIGIIAVIYAWLVVEAFIARMDGPIMFCYLQLVIYTLVMPCSIYGAISGEREKATWEALTLTRLTPAQILAGKLVWRFRLVLALALMLIVPIFAASLNNQGYITAVPGRVFGGEVMTIAWGFLLCSFGLWISSLTRRSAASLGIIAVSVLFVLLVLPGLYAMLASGIVSNWNSMGSPDYLFSWMIAMNPFWSLGMILTNQSSAYGYWVPAYVFTGWVQTIFYALLSVLLIVMTSLRLRRLEEPRRRGG